MSKESTLEQHPAQGHHTKAAEHHEHAMKHHKEAAGHYASGHHETAAHHGTPPMPIRFMQLIM